MLEADDILPNMAITLDPPTEQRIERELTRTGYSTPAELISHALDLVSAEEDWLTRNREAIHADIEHAFEVDERGEGFTSGGVMQEVWRSRQAG